VLERVDHLVYAAADLDEGIAAMQRLLGVRASYGGRHPAWGTHNALAALGPKSYLEIIAPDPEYSVKGAVRPFGLDGYNRERVVGWAANGTGLETLRSMAARQGVVLGDVMSGSRRRTDGTVLTWKLTDLCCVVADGIVPFFIDWGRSSHPATFAPEGATLVALRAEHPEADRVRDMLRGLALDLQVDAGPAPALIAEIDCPKGRVALR
jgi:hypothetical protein